MRGERGGATSSLLLRRPSSAPPRAPPARSTPSLLRLLAQNPAPLPPCCPLPAATAGQPAGVRVGKMQKTKRKGICKNMARLNKKQNASRAVHQQCIAFEDGFGNLVKSCGNSSSNPTKQIESELSESVVSLASFNGDSVVSECTGIFIENLCADTTTILTSASLVGSLRDGITNNLTIKVRLPSDRVVIGWLDKFDFKYDLAVVKIRRARGFQEAHLSSSHRVQFESSSKVEAVGRCFDSGMLKFTNGTVIGPARYGLRRLVLSAYIMNTALSGCPLIDIDGNFVGVCLQRGKITAFVPVSKILEFYSGTTRHSAADTSDKRGSNRHCAADTIDIDKRCSERWTLFYKSLNEDLDLFQLDQNVFHDREEHVFAVVC